MRGVLFRVFGEEGFDRLRIDQRIDIEFGRNDLRPFVKQAVQLLVRADIKQSDSAASSARIE